MWNKSDCTDKLILDWTKLLYQLHDPKPVLRNVVKAMERLDVEGTQTTRSHVLNVKRMLSIEAAARKCIIKERDIDTMERHRIKINGQHTMALGRVDDLQRSGAEGN